MALNSVPADPVLREYLVNAIQANRRSADVSGLLVTYLGQNISKREPVDLSEICRQHLPGIEAAIPSGISTDSYFMYPGPVVRANASQLQQVLAILITNAWEAIRDTTGKVTVEVKVVPASIIPKSHVAHITWEASPGMFACLEVTDTGCGISKKDMVKVFDPFYTNKFTGRGLGLAVAMSLVRGWDGMIYVNSEVGKGSSFRVYLPLALDVSPLQADLLTEQEISQAEGMVLLVDDDPKVCEIAKALLEHIGFNVLVAEGGLKAVALFEKHYKSIVCLLTDLSMSDMNGWETLTALRKIKPDLPAILSSGYDEAHVMTSDHKERPQAFLHKPYTKDSLKNVLNRVLGDAKKSGPLKM